MTKQKVSYGFLYVIKYLDEVIYVGKCFGRDWGTRKNQHICFLKAGCHHSDKLQNIWNYAGEDMIYFEDICAYRYITEKELNDEEEKYIAKFNTQYSKNGCNKSAGGSGVKMSKTEEEKIRQSEIKKEAYKTGEIRPTFGEINGMHILSEEDVKNIILDLRNGLTRKNISKKYEVSEATISAISVGKRWSYLKEVQDYASNRTIRNWRKPFEKSEIYEIKMLIFLSPLTQDRISKDYNTSRETIRKIEKGSRHVDVDISLPYSFYKSKERKHAMMDMYYS